MAPKPTDDRLDVDHDDGRKSSQPPSQVARAVSQGDDLTLDGGRESTDTTSLGDAVTLGGSGSANLPWTEDGVEIVDLAARYRVERVLGRGGMGEISLAVDTRLNRKVAIKRILGQVAQERIVVQRFMTEARSIAALNHPNIVQIHDYGQAVDGPFLIMEYVDGGSLADLCQDGPVPHEVVIDLIAQLCDGLNKAHAMGIVHRDIKPANVLLTSDGVPKLTDFGLAKIEATEFGMTMTGAVLGTLDFMPPEQRRSADQVDARSDLWSLAATAYALLTGASPRTIRLDRVPAPWQPLLSRGLEEAPERRFANAAEFRQALDDLAAKVRAGAVAEVVVGQCTHCKSRNEPSRRFCHSCSQPLHRSCRTCQSEMAVWYDVCGECGNRHSVWVAQHRRQLADWQGQAESAAQQGNYLLADKWIQHIRPAIAEENAELAAWLATFAAEVTQKLHAQRIEVTGLVRVALESLQQYDYSQAVAALSQIPLSVHGTIVPTTGDTIDQLWRQTQLQAATVERLEKEIRRRVKDKQIQGLLPLAEQFLVLQPTHTKILKLAAQLRARETLASEPSATNVARTPLYLQQASLGNQEADTALPVPEAENRLNSIPRLVWPLVGLALGVLMLAGLAWAGAGLWAPDLGTTAEEPMAADSQATEMVPTIVNSVGMTLQWLPAGSLQMGSPLDEAGRNADESPQSLSIDGFYLGAFEVSVAQYNRVMDLAPPSAAEADLPKTDVTWEQAVAFCDRLTRQPGEFQARRLYYLPSEPQWEFARRAGQTTSFGLDRELEQLPEYQAVEAGELLPITATTPNAWGIHGIVGNAREWTSNLYAPSLMLFRVRPQGPPGGQERSVRGGKARAPYSYRSAQRDRLFPHQSAHDLGFRVAMRFMREGLAPPSPLTPLGSGSANESNPQAKRPTENPPSGQTTTAADAVRPERRYTTQELAAQQRQLNHATEQQIAVEVQNTIGMKLRWCPPGEFSMGSPLTEEGRGDDEWQHRVQLTRGFYLGVHEVTQMQYELVTGKLPHQISGRHSRSPLTGLSYEAAVEFCKQLSQLPAEVEAGRTYRLPTEAEWEYACRADTETAYYFGDDPIHWRQYVTVRNLATATPVAQLWPNAWGFYDLLGTPYEYCSGWYGRYPSGLVQDPGGFDSGTNVVVRGGDAEKKFDTGKYEVSDFRSAKRSKIHPGSPHNVISFRVVMVPTEMEAAAQPQVKSSGEAP